MGFFDKLMKKKDDKNTEGNQKEITEEIVKEYEETRDIMAMSDYMLADVKKEDINDNSFKVPLDKITELGPLATSSIETLKTIMKNNPSNGKKMYRVTNLGRNDKLKMLKDGKSFWGTIKRGDGSTSFAKFKEVNPSNVMVVDPTMIMVTAALYSIEKELGEIKELTQKILTFLENEKEAQIETDLELLKKIMTEAKYNDGNDKFMITYCNQIADIVRNAHTNIKTYKRKNKDTLSKANLFTTDGSMKTMLGDLLNIFKYYRLSLFIYSFATYLEIFLNGNFKSEYMLQKRDYINELVSDYNVEFENALEYVKNNAGKTLKGNILSGLGSASNAVGNLVEKVKEGSVDTWLHEKSDSLKQTSETIKDSYVAEFETMRETNVKMFICQIEYLDQIYNKTTDIYFDQENIYLQMQS